jgi:hypothetical protein
LPPGLLYSLIMRSRAFRFLARTSWAKRFPSSWLSAVLVGSALIASASGLGGLCPSPVARDNSGRLPKIVLWAWDEPEDLGYVNPRRVGIAFLAETLYLRAHGVGVRPRLQTLRFPPAAKLIAVARIEYDSPGPARLSLSERRQVATAIARLDRIPGVVGIQVDFDATKSQRAFYRGLLFDLRKQIPPSTSLSITALASWCLGDPWLAHLPIDEAVPMLFQMGREGGSILLHLDGGGDFSDGACRQSLGIATNERNSRLPAGRRLYVFRPAPWTPQALEPVLEEAKRWE